MTRPELEAEVIRAADAWERVVANWRTRDIRTPEIGVRSTRGQVQRAERALIVAVQAMRVRQ